MKHLTTLLLTLLVLGGCGNDNDKKCHISWLETDDFSTSRHLKEYLYEQCDSNNILEIDGMPHYQTVGVIGSYCRFDRQIVITVSYPDSEEYNDMSCVLNDNESRELYRIKRKRK